MIEIATVLFCILLLGLSVFQVTLILGAPIGKYAWGGKHNVLPVKLKAASIISIALYMIFIVIVLSKVGVIPLFKDPAVVNIGTWTLAGYFFIGVLMNGISRSKPERNLMTPIALVLAIACTIIAAS